LLVVLLTGTIVLTGITARCSNDGQVFYQGYESSGKMVAAISFYQNTAHDSTEDQSSGDT